MSKHIPIQTIQERCDELARRLLNVTITAELAIAAVGELSRFAGGYVAVAPLDDNGQEIAGTRRVLVDDETRQANHRKAHEAAQAFRVAIDNAIDGIGLVDTLTCKIAGLDAQDWQSGLKAALRKIGGTYTTWGWRLFDKGADVLRRQLTIIQAYDEQLRSAHIPSQSDSVQAEPATAGEDVAADTGGTTANVPPRARKAYEQYRKVCNALDKEKPTDREAYDWLEKANEAAEERSIDTQKNTLPQFDTWQRNLRIYRKSTNSQKNNPKAGRAVIGKSITNIHGIEPRSLPGAVRPKQYD